MEKKQGTAKTYFDTSDMKYLNLLQNLCKRTYRRLLTIFDISSSLYPELFQILWQSTLPCFGHDGSDHMLLDCLVGGNTSLNLDYIIIDIIVFNHLVNSTRVSISHPHVFFCPTNHLLQLSGKKINCSDYFTRVPTDSGMCCALNSEKALRFEGIIMIS